MSQKHGDYADNGLPPPFRLPAYLLSLSGGIVFSLPVYAGTLFVLVLSHLRRQLAPAGHTRNRSLDDQFRALRGARPEDPRAKNRPFGRPTGFPSAAARCLQQAVDRPSPDGFALMPLEPARPLVDSTPPRWQAVCRECGRTFPVPEAETDELFKLGWPVCCDRDMTILYHPTGVPPADRPPDRGK